MLAGGGGSPPPEVSLVLDHPFDFEVVADADHLVLFAGHVEDPSVGTG